MRPDVKQEDGAEDGTRTRDLLITNQLLYQLSYFGIIWEGEDGTPLKREQAQPHLSRP